MTSIVRQDSGALPSIEKARAMLEQCRRVNECQKIRALAQAVASCAATEQARDHAAAIVLLAKARIGELTAQVKATPNDGRRGNQHEARSRPERATRTDRLAAEGLSRKDAAECEKIAELKKSGDLDRMIAAPGGATTTAAALALARLTPEKRAEVIEKVEAGVPHERAIDDTRRAERNEHLAEIARGNAPLEAPPERFPILYADPPWRYEHTVSESRAIENQYPTMSLDDICALPVPTVVTPDAVLFLWVTSPKLDEGMRVVRDWGFTYRTCMVWDKEKIGMGYYARQQHELLFICTRGAPPAPPPEARPASVVRIARGEHSAKPTWFYEMIERMYPTLPKLEMFCRAPRDGWQAWGNQSRAA